MVRILSDIHGEVKPLYDFINSDCKYCIQLGDFGLIFANSIIQAENLKINKLSRHLKKEDKYIFTVLGNHENYDRISKLESTMIYGAQVYKIADNIYAVNRGEILELEGKTFLCIGGANSTDKEWRLEYEKNYGEKIWWEQEGISFLDTENALNNAVRYDNKVDFICTHDEPYAFHLRNDPADYWGITKSQLLLDRIFNVVEFQTWFGGHIHETRQYLFSGESITSLGIDEYIDLDFIDEHMDLDFID